MKAEHERVFVSKYEGLCYYCGRRKTRYYLKTEGMHPFICIKCLGYYPETANYHQLSLETYLEVGS